MKIKLATISGAVKDYPNEKRIYEAALKVDPDLKGYFTIKKLHKKQDYLFSVDTDCWKDLGNALTALQVAYVNEDEPCLYISNLPDTYEEADVFQLTKTTFNLTGGGEIFFYQKSAVKFFWGKFW